MAEQPTLDAASLSGWRKSSYSNDQGGSCLEVLDGHPAGIPVRDSKAPYGPVLVMPTAEWRTFIGAVKAGALGHRD
ncbi:DUF397 domain-containing protein [Streptomyces sp. NPDC057621]|uniref:DUF397 domain-containing protein n=1 Tax=Streptomyces liliiviolaceus TaxID=2823109 RepID=A0A940XQV4_9ACTN|nr:DUF397 domain-containing protein [Streptomyces liliiviolaceus]MBQ0848852.1 DUF397 domain-containing protein [Streptomyces liliiviolaceus]